MYYAKVNATKVITFPYSWDMLQDENQHTVFDDRFNLVEWYAKTEDAAASGNTIVAVIEQPMPVIDWVIQNATKADTPIYNIDGWVLPWVITDKTAEEIAAYQASVSLPASQSA